MPLILPSIRAYNLEQLTAVEHPEENGVPAHCVSRSTMLTGLPKLTTGSHCCLKPLSCLARSKSGTLTPLASEALPLTTHRTRVPFSFHLLGMPSGPDN